MPPSIIPGVQPMTVVEKGQGVPLTEMVRRILKTRDDHGPTLQAYHQIWYNAPHTWCFTDFLGVGIMKSPNDLWMYQTLMTQHRPQVVIETGTYKGASAMWLAYLMDMLGIDGGRIYTIDYEDHRHPRCQHPRITFMAGDSTNPFLVKAIADDMPEGRRLISLDSDHSAAHVYAELKLYAPLARVGDWVVVEDTNISWPGPDGDRGAAGGVTDYLSEHPGEFMQDILAERFLYTANPGGWLQRVK